MTDPEILLSPCFEIMSPLPYEVMLDVCIGHMEQRRNKIYHGSHALLVSLLSESQSSYKTQLCQN